MTINHSITNLAAAALLSISTVACNSQKDMDTIYQFTVQCTNGVEKSLADYKGKVLLVVNTASRCGFTPQYEELEAMYSELHTLGFEILDFPCNQFGQQAPETDEEYVSFCQLNYHTEFTQFHKIEVNGEKEIPLYTWLKAQKSFAGFDAGHKLTPILENMFDASMPGWREISDIKWNFTKFLVDRKGKVVERFEPTSTADQIIPAIKNLL